MLLCIQTSPRKPILTKSIRSVYVVSTAQQGEAGAVVPSAFANLQTLFDAVNCARLAYNTLVISCSESRDACLLVPPKPFLRRPVDPDTAPTAPAGVVLSACSNAQGTQHSALIQSLRSTCYHSTIDDRRLRESGPLFRREEPRTCYTTLSISISRHILSVVAPD